MMRSSSSVIFFGMMVASSGLKLNKYSASAHVDKYGDNLDEVQTKQIYDVLANGKFCSAMMAAQTMGGIFSKSIATGATTAAGCATGTANDGACSVVFWYHLEQGCTCLLKPLTWKDCDPTTGAGFTIAALNGNQGGAGGDPKVTNFAGQRFEILALGTFSFLSITEDSSSSPLLSLHAFIDRAGSRCGATYIKNITIAGTWISERENFRDVEVRAVPGVLKDESLQVAFNAHQDLPPSNASDRFRGASHVGYISKLVKRASSREVRFEIHGVKVQVTIDAHRIRDQKGMPVKNHFANFLNVNVKGVKNLQRDGMHVNGLLAYDEHASASELPDECKQEHGRKFDLMEGHHRTSDAHFLSNVEVY